MQVCLLLNNSIYQPISREYSNITFLSWNRARERKERERERERDRDGEKERESESEREREKEMEGLRGGAVGLGGGRYWMGWSGSGLCRVVTPPLCPWGANYVSCA